MRGLLGVIAVVVLLLAAPVPLASAQSAPFCGPGQAPQFRLGFADLKARVGAPMGDPVECEHADGTTGDTLQETTRGLSFWRRSTNTPTFTDGNRHWALTPAGLLYWEGSSIDPPAGAVVLAPAAPPGPARPPAADSTLERFVRGLVPQIDAYWRDRFAASGVAYATPRVLWLERGQAASTRCWRGLPPSPGYCPLDDTLFLPASFFEPIWLRGDDAAVAVVVAHEWGHHVQRLLGTLNSGYQNIQEELQADCYAGSFFGYADAMGWLDPGDIDEAVRMAATAGDRPGIAASDPRAHGSSDQRVNAFRRGLGDPMSCAAYTP